MLAGDDAMPRCSETMRAVMKTLDDWLAHCERLHPKHIELGLERVRAVAERMGLRFDCPVFTVAGTNGKGSTCAMLEAVLLQAGYRTGVYTSPHLVRFEERCRVRGEAVDASELIAALRRVERRQGRYCPDLLRIHHAGHPAAAGAAPGWTPVILEVGLGGRLDAVNLIDADCAIITSIDIDHTELLGDTREPSAWRRPASCAPAGPPSSATRCRRSVIDHAPGHRRRPVAGGARLQLQRRPQQWAWAGRGRRYAGWPTRRCAAPTSCSTPPACWRR
jgi:dihydrofolate synthase/folylpolyglutamate synthase